MTPPAPGSGVRATGRWKVVCAHGRVLKITAVSSSQGTQVRQSLSSQGRDGLWPGVSRGPALGVWGQPREPVPSRIPKPDKRELWGVEDSQSRMTIERADADVGVTVRRRKRRSGRGWGGLPASGRGHRHAVTTGLAAQRFLKPGAVRHGWA